MTDTPSLSSRLDAAAEGDPIATRAFFEELLSSSVYIVDASKDASGRTSAATGSKSPELQFVRIEDRIVLPVFSESSFVVTWAQREVATVVKSFKAILHFLDGNVWIHLNPNQPVGKELSPWELDLLRQGPDTIPEIVAELCEEYDSDVEVVETDESDEELKRALIALLEAYHEVREGFLVRIRKEGDTTFQPALGLVLEATDELRRKALQEELEATVTRHVQSSADLYVLDDLANTKSQNWILFRQLTPFYFRTEELPQKQNWFRQILRKFHPRSS